MIITTEQLLQIQDNLVVIAGAMEAITKPAMAVSQADSAEICAILSMEIVAQLPSHGSHILQAVKSIRAIASDIKDQH